MISDNLTGRNIYIAGINRRLTGVNRRRIGKCVLLPFIDNINERNGTGRNFENGCVRYYGGYSCYEDDNVVMESENALRTLLKNPDDENFWERFLNNPRFLCLIVVVRFYHNGGEYYVWCMPVTVEDSSDSVCIIRIPDKIYQELTRELNVALANNPAMRHSRLFQMLPDSRNYHKTFTDNMIFNMFPRVKIPKVCLGKWRTVRFRIRMVGQLALWQNAAKERLYAPGGAFCYERADNKAWQALVYEEIGKMSGKRERE